MKYFAIYIVLAIVANNLIEFLTTIMMGAGPNGGWIDFVIYVLVDYKILVAVKRYEGRKIMENEIE